VDYSQNVHVEERRDCANCGAVLAGDARFCQRCGAPVALMVAPSEDEDEAPVAEAPEEPPSPLRFWAPRIAAAVLVVATAGAVLFTMLVLLFGAFVE
jgi:hypothetical protein